MDRVEVVVRKRKAQGVAAQEPHAAALFLVLAVLEHGRAEVEADHGSVHGLVERGGEVARAGAYVQHRPLGLCQGDGALAPPLVHVEGEQVVQEVVARRDDAEHRLDRGRILAQARKCTKASVPDAGPTSGGMQTPQLPQDLVY